MNDKCYFSIVMEYQAAINKLLLNDDRKKNRILNCLLSLRLLRGNSTSPGKKIKTVNQN